MLSRKQLEEIATLFENTFNINVIEINEEDEFEQTDASIEFDNNFELQFSLDNVVLLNFWNKDGFVTFKTFNNKKDLINNLDYINDIFKNSKGQL